MNILIVVDMKAILNNSLLRTQYKTFNYHIHLLGIHELISQKQIFIMTFHVCLKFIYSSFFQGKNAFYTCTTKLYFGDADNFISTI